MATATVQRTSSEQIEYVTPAELEARLEQLAFPEIDLSTLATKEELQGVRRDISGLDERLQEVEQRYLPLDQIMEMLTNHGQTLVEHGAAISSIRDALAGMGGSSSGAAFGYFRAIVVKTATETAVRKGITDWLATRNSGGFLQAFLLLDFVGEVNMSSGGSFLPDTTQLRNPVVLGRGKQATVLSTSRTDVPFWKAVGTLRNWLIGNFSIKSLVAATATALPVGFDMVSTWSVANQDGVFESIEWQGAWDSGWRFSGGPDSNLNSEIVFSRPAANNGASAKNGWWWSGSDSANGGDQFLNYTIRDSKMECSHGIIMKLTKGGQWTLEGFNSWFFTGNSDPVGGPNNGVGTLFVLENASHFESAPILRIHSMRPEIRGNNTTVMDCAWGQNATVYFAPGYDDSSWAYQQSGVWKINDNGLYKFRGAAYVLFDFARLAGHVETFGPATIHMRAVRSVGNRSEMKVSTAGIVRSMSGPAPTVVFS